MTYTVRGGDSLSSIAWRTLGDAGRWHEIARLNGIAHGDIILVGQQLRLPPRSSPAPAVHLAAAPHPALRMPHGQNGTSPSLVPGRFYMFALADEVNPLRGKVIRRVIVNQRMADEAAARVGKNVRVFQDPERFGFVPTGPADSKIGIARHVKGEPGSNYVSASRAQPFGARRINGRPFWIDEAKARASGATFHEVDEIMVELHKLLARTKDARSRAKIQHVMQLVPGDREVLVKGGAPATAIKGPLSMGLTRGMQGVEIIGFAMSAYDLKQAADKSQRTHSMRPLAAETVRQAGGWAAAWAGMKLGALGGAAVGIETGPGAVLTAVGGGIVGGIAGYYGFDWIADHLDKN